MGAPDMKEERSDIGIVPLVRVYPDLKSSV